MGKQLLSIPSFTAGEMSDSMQGRTDFAKYFSAASRIENFVVLPHGPITRRPGTYFVAEVKTSSAKTRLIPFSFSTEQTYVLEFGNQYIRFYKDDGQITSGGSAYEISSPYTTAQLFDLKFAQSADVMYICNENHPVKKLSRTGHTSWTLADVDFTDGPYLDSNTSSTTMTPSGTSGSITITASSSAFVSTDVNRFINFSNGYAKITAFTSATVVSATVENNFDNTNAVTDWKLGAFSTTTGFPRCVSFFEQRLVFAGTSNQPQTMFFSKSGDYENMTSGTNDDDAMIYTIASNQVNAIQALKATRTLIVMTTGGEYAVSSGASQDAITPTNINIRKQSNYGSSGVDALSIGNATIFLQRARRKIRELAYNFDTDGYTAPDLTILADHISESGLTDMSYQQEPYSVVWAVRADGQMAGLTYNRLENVVAWHRHIFGGKSDTGKTVKQQKISFTANSTNVNTTSNQITITGHGLATGDQVYYYAASNKIGGLSNSKVYYVIAVDVNNIKLAISTANASANTAISLTSAPGSDTTQFIYQGVNINNNILFVSAHGFKSGNHIFYKNSGTAISGLSENTKYFVEKIDDNQIQLYSDEARGTVVNLTSAHSSEQTDKILTHAKVESVACIDGDGEEDQVWVIVQRYINGATKRYVEYFTPFEFNEDLTAFHFLDSGLTYTGGETSSLSGLTHLEGEVVDIIGEGSVQNSKTVSSGAVSLDTAIEEAQVGLLYSSDLQTMRLDEGYTETTQTKTVRVFDLSVRFQNTVGASVGPSSDNLTNIDFRDSGASMDLPVPLFTGDKQIEFDAGHGVEGLIYVKQPQALPMTILGIYPRLETESV
ncbi:putative tail tubular protein B [uncultured Mediterranean phage uvMED]|nr:putative tail tubular protein B [uncultured Mediterranean phage uvMED]